VLRHNPLKKDPSTSSRFAASLQTCRDSSKQKVLFVNHHSGGGIERHIRELAVALRDKIEMITIRPLDSMSVILRIGTDLQGAGLRFFLPSHYHELLKLCRYLKISRVHFHHLMGIHPAIRKIANDLEVPYDITLHDYYLINANPVLADRHGRFCENMADRDRLCAQSMSIPDGLSAEQWRGRQNDFLESADRVFIPSEYAARVHLDYFPNLRPIITWHPDWEKNAPYPNPRLIRLDNNSPMRVASIGMLSKEKGADLFESCAKQAKHRQLPLEFHLIGYALRPLSRSIQVHGMYEERELGRLISEIDPHVIWFPAQWPETYSYTLSAALVSGKPLVVPNIGAFEERVLGRPLTWVESWDQPTDQWLSLFLALRQKMQELRNRGQERIWKDQTSLNRGFTYSSDYVFATPVKQTQTNGAFTPTSDWIRQFMCWNKWSKKEAVLHYLFRLTQYPVIAVFLNMVPYHRRRQIKRLFSRKSIHEIMR
jgi:glycosyltransferase involved in cell wall biosynthesis